MKNTARLLTLLMLAAVASSCGGETSAPPAPTPECTSAADCSDDDPCTDDLCEDGECGHRDNTAPCDDGDLCTVGDVCRSGECAGAAMDCGSAADACNTGSCNAETGACDKVAVEDGTQCNDGSACTISDACVGGQCRGRQKDCSAFGNACNVGSCNPATGACQSAPTNEGGACNDMNACTVDDRCSSGRCAGSAKDCSSLNTACSRGECSRQTGECLPTAINENGNCDDADACTTADRCRGGACRGNAKDCSDLDGECTEGACEAGTGECVSNAVREGEGCDDGDLCTELDHCDTGVCVGSDLDCSAHDGACAEGVCDAANGECKASPINQGLPCEDEDPCTSTGMCSDGACEVETRTTLLAGQTLPNQAGWTPSSNAPSAMVRVVANSVLQVSTEGADPAADGAVVLFSREIGAWERQGLILEWEMKVEISAEPLAAGEGAVAIFGSFTSVEMRAADFGQAVVIAETGVSWGDLSGRMDFDTTDAFHRYRLEVDADGMAMLLVDGEVKLTRSGFALNGTVAFGDPDGRREANSRFEIRGIARECTGVQ